MSKPIVVVIHGMGVHTKDSFKKEIQTPLDNASERFVSIDKFSDTFEVISIAYDEIWNEIREKLADNAGSISDSLSGITDQGNLAAIATKLTSIEAKFNDDSFLYTHVLDVILYKTFYGERTRVHVAKELVKAIRKANDTNRPIHIIAHSLGTAVIHDVLHKIFENEHTGDIPSDLGIDTPNLDPLENQLYSLYMVANVSCVVDGSVDAHKSAVRPGAKKLCGQMINVHHKFDPFTLVKSFVRERSDGWINEQDWDDQIYRDIQTRRVLQVNIHDIGHYLNDPLVYQDIFNTMYDDFDPTDAEIATADQAHIDAIVDAANGAVKKAIESANWTIPQSAKDFWEVLSKYYQTLEELKTLAGIGDE